MSATLADVLRKFGPAYLARHILSTVQAKAWRAIVACRTALLGGPAQANGTTMRVASALSKSLCTSPT